MAEAPKAAPPTPPKAPSQPEAPGGPPTDLGPGYAVERQIGTGSFATVWLATKDRTPVAIKAVDRSRLTKKLRANLDDEIRILGSVKHPNLVAFVDAVPRTERIYVVLEFLQGGDLQKYIRSKGRLHEGTAQRWIGHLAAGLECLWRRSLVHRDLKPQNLLLTEASDNGTLKIGDFGFARQLGPSKLAETLCGSPLYMAPEILALKRYDAKADLWSAGTVLFEMVAGRPPYSGRDHRDLLRNIRRKALRLPKDVTVSRECLDVLQKLLRRDPLKRCAFEDFFRDPFVNGCALTAVVGDPFALAPVAEVSSSPPEKLASPILRAAQSNAASSLLASKPPPFMTPQKAPSAPFAALVSSSSSSPRATPRKIEGRPPRSPTSLKKPPPPRTPSTPARKGPPPPPFASQNSPAKASLGRMRSMSDPTEPPTPVKTPSPPAASPRRRSSTVDGRSLDELTLQGYVVVDDPTSLQAHRVQVFAAFALSRLADGVKSGEDECEAGKAVVLYGEALRGLKRVATALVPHKNEAKAAELLSLVEDARQSIVERAASCRDMLGATAVDLPSSRDVAMGVCTSLSKRGAQCDQNGDWKAAKVLYERAVEGFRALLALGGLSDEATDHVVAMVGPEGALLDALKTIDDQL